MNQIKVDVNAAIEANWDKFTEHYVKYEVNTLQGTVALATLAEMPKATRVLEVACGSGLHSLFLA